MRHSEKGKSEMTTPQNQPPTDPPPATAPPVDQNPPVPPAQQPKPPVVVQSSQDFSPLLDAIGSIPEKVANAVREQIPQTSPTPPAAPNAGDQSTGGNTQQTPTKAPAQTQQTGNTMQATGRRTFGEWWTGVPKRGA